MKPVVKVFLIGCGALTLFGAALVVWLGVWLFSGPESGVKLGNVGHRPPGRGPILTEIG